jgi:hypothetical protein
LGPPPAQLTAALGEAEGEGRTCSRPTERATPQTLGSMSVAVTLQPSRSCVVALTIAAMGPQTKLIVVLRVVKGMLGQGSPLV